jgi:alpha-amylase/alpha-mannosidase (GH57 family)
MTRVALLWHMHQPFYQDLATGEHILPWVRLHALKDYWGMAALTREFPALKLTFNLVPSLLVQLEAFASGQARDRHLDVGLTPADQLSESDRQFCAEHFFHAHRARMIDPFPRYAELLATRDAGRRRGNAAAGFTTDDLRDLQVWHKLVWVDPSYADLDPRVRALLARGRDFSEQDKQTLRAVELEILGKVVGEYRAGAERGQIEISTSPFYHPILPLLCDASVYLKTNPSWPPPEQPFAYPQDASEQLRRATALHQRLFGRTPTGLWPSEGSVSDAMVPLVAEAGFAWMATDEEILARSLSRTFARDADLYRAYRIGSGTESVACGFRDHLLSDLVGFTYSSWDAAVAADDFVNRIAATGERYRAQRGGEEATVFVVLDGENAWEHYEGQGRPFLRALYDRLVHHGSLRTVTMAEACADASERLPAIHPGSWINADFYIWIGHADDRRAWGQLSRARRALEHASGVASAEALAAAREELLIAEGSDWCWWYGDDHHSDHDRDFDDLFRRHVRNIYRALGLPIPEDLFVTNITTMPPKVTLLPPTGPTAPKIDGRESSYFEWLGAGDVTPSATAGAMHQVAVVGQRIAGVRFGFSDEALCVQVTTAEPLTGSMAQGGELTVAFLDPPGTRIAINGAHRAGVVFRRTADGTWLETAWRDLEAAVDAIAELRIPFERLGLREHAELSFVVTLRRSARDVDESTLTVEATVPGRRPGRQSWRA